MMKQQLQTLNLILRIPQEEDFTALKNFEDRNKNHLAEWESTADFSSEQYCRNRLNDWIAECKQKISLRFFIFTKQNPHQIIGLLNFTQIFRGTFQACYLGYKIDAEYEGKGFMFEALQSSIRYVFEEIGIHRIMANYMPINARSAKLLNRLGFEVEGFSKNYLLINNKWEDHVLTALSYEKWKALEEESHLILEKVSIVKELEDYLYQHIPLSKAMGIKVAQASLVRVILTAPFSNNINHKKTVFGGSLHAVATLACWSLIYIHLKNKRDQPSQIIITESHVVYHAPVDADFKVECATPSDDVWQRFMKMLQAKGKARVQLSAQLHHHDRLCVTYNGTFAVIAV